jgi:hypothetical protein
LQGLSLVVDLGVVVEHQELGRLGSLFGPAEEQFDRVGQLVRARGDEDGLGLGHDRLQLVECRTGLQRDRYCGDLAQRDVDGGVVDAVEAQHAHPVTGLERVAGQGAGQRADAVAQLSVGDRVETGKDLQSGSPGRGVFDEIHRPVGQSRPVGVAVENRLHDLRQPQPGLFQGGGDRRIGPGSGELRVVGGQVVDAAGQPVVVVHC